MNELDFLGWAVSNIGMTLAGGLAALESGLQTSAQQELSLGNVIIQVATALFAAGGAYVAVKMEIKQLRGDVDKLTTTVDKMIHSNRVVVRKFTELAAEHRLNHDSVINLNGLDNDGR